MTHRLSSYGASLYAIWDTATEAEKELISDESLPYKEAVNTRQRLYKFRDLVRRREDGAVIHRWDATRIILIPGKEEGKFDLVFTRDDLHYRKLAFRDTATGISKTVEEILRAWQSRQVAEVQEIIRQTIEPRKRDEGLIITSPDDIFGKE